MCLTALLGALLCAPQGDPHPLLVPNTTLRGEITAGDTVVATDELRVSHADHDVLAHRSRWRPDVSGTYTLELRSLEFDPYLVLRDTDGHALAEADGGFFAWDARLVHEVEAGRTYLVDACALYGGHGGFDLRLYAGAPTALTPRERAQGLLARNHENVRFWRERHGERSTSHATALGFLGHAHFGNGSYDQARTTWERSLELREALLGPDDPLTIQSLNNVAVALMKVGLLEEAQARLETVLERQVPVFGPEHEEIATTLSNLGLLLERRGQYDAALARHERAVEIARAAHGEEDARTATMINNQAIATKKLGHFAQARELHERSLAIRRQTLEPDDPAIGGSLNNLGAVLNSLGEYDRAVETLRAALEVYGRSLRAGHPELGKTWGNLANALRDRGDLEGACQAYERALRIEETALGREHRNVATTLNSYAWALMQLGRHELARPFYERALALRQRALAPDHPEVGSALNNLAWLLREVNNPEEALPLFERSLAIVTARLGPEHHDTTVSMCAVAGTLRVLGHVEEARELCERALEIEERTLGTAHPTTCGTLLSLAFIERDQGDYAGERSYLERALTCRLEALGHDHARTANVHSQLGVALRRAGEPERALEHTLRAREIRVATFGATHPDTALTSSNLAFVLMDLGRETEAWEAALEGFTAGTDAWATVLWSLSGWERVRAWQAQSWHLEMLLALAGRSGDPLYEALAYEGVLNWKGHVGRGLLQDRERVFAVRDAAERELVARLRDVQTRLGTEVHRTDVGGVDGRARLLTELRHERGALERELATLAHASAGDATPSVGRVAAALPQRAVLIDFLVRRGWEPAERDGERVVRSGRWTEELLTAWVLRAGAERAVRVELGPARSLREDTARFLAAMGATRGEGLSAADTAEAAGAQLRAALWDPLVAHLGAAELVFVSPHGFLGTLPFEVLPLADGTYALESHSFVYLRDAATLARPAAPAPAAECGLLAVGGVDYDAHEGLAVATPAAARTRGRLQEYWERLRYTAKEAATVADLYATLGEAAAEAQLVTGREATEELLKSELPRARTLHLATHGFFQPEGVASVWEAASAARDETERITGLMPGLLSGLVAAGANRPVVAGRDNGLLTAEEVTWLDLSGCDLVVLSACQTGLGTERGGEGMMSLREAFRLAGARTVISSLWNVDDETTSDLMRAFYKRLWIDGEGKIEALRGARLDLLRANRARRAGRGEPWTWGAFVLSGDWR